MKHLSSEQISSVVAGLRIPEESHVLECAACAQEVERMKGVLTLFRGSVREWTDKLDHSEFPVREVIASGAYGSHRPRRSPMVWVLATAALAAAVAIPMYQDAREQEMKVQAQRDQRDKENDHLMEAINAQLSRSGPVAMDPLMRLMAFPEGGSGTDSTKSRGAETEANDGANH